MSLFQQSHTVGIDISDTSVEILELSKKHEIVRYARLFLPAGVVEDGKILAPDKLSDKLRELLLSAQPKPFSIGNDALSAYVSLPESQTFIHVFTVPASLSGEALRERIRHEAEKIIPFETGDLFWDILEKPPPLRKKTETPSGDEDEKTKHVLYIGTLRSVVEEYRGALFHAGIVPSVVEAESLSIARALLGPDYFKKLAWENNKTPSSAMVLDLGARMTVASIFGSDGFLEFSVIIPLGGDNFRETIQKKFNIPEAEAEELKRRVGFDYEKHDKDASVIVLQLQSDLQKILKELQGAISYQEKKSGERVAQIILAGGSSLTPKIDEYLALNLDRPVSRGDPLKKVENSAFLAGTENSILFANVIGLALRDDGMSDINLLTEKNHGFFSRFFKKGTEEDGVNTSAKNTNIHKNTKAFVLGAVFLLLIGILGALIFWNMRNKEPEVIYVSEELQSEEERGSSPVSGDEALLASTSAEMLNDDSENARKENELSTDDALFQEGEDGIFNESLEKIVIRDTPTGWLNVREGPGTEFPVLLRVYPEESYLFLEEKDGWYKIELVSEMVGWVSNQYAKKGE